MSGARDEILARLGRALGSGGDARAAREADVAAWRTARAGKADGNAGLRPERATRTGDARRKQFIEEAERSRSLIIEIDDLAQLPGAIADYLRRQNAGGTIRIAPHPDLESLDWSALENAVVGRAEPSDALSVSVAAAAAAETGSVAFVGGPQSPATLHVLPLHHVSVVYASRIEAGYEDALNRARADYGPATNGMPRHLNIITGPSRTADIEQTLLMGAHGPQAEVVVVVENR